MIFHLIKRILLSLWHTIAGVFYLGSRIRNREIEQKRADVHFYYKQKSKKEMAKFQVAEQMRTKRMIKNARRTWLPKKYRQLDVYLYHNYFANVLAPMRPNQTPQGMLKRYWDDGVGPYFILYKAAVEELKALLETKGFLPKDLQNILNSLPDLDKRAEAVLEAQKKVNLRLREEQKKYNAQKDRAMDEMDKELLKVDEAVLARTVQKSSEQLKNLRRAKKQQGVK